jgi:hypothetical protein
MFLPACRQAGAANLLMVDYADTIKLILVSSEA